MRTVVAIIILSYSKTADAYTNTVRCIQSLAQSRCDAQIRIKVIETNASYGTRFVPFSELCDNVSVEHVDLPTFNFNQSVKHGISSFLREYPPESIAAFVISNNDVVYAESCIQELEKCLQDHGVVSVSPWMPGYHESLLEAIGDTQVVLGYRSGIELTGWCYAFRASMLESLTLDSLFPSELEFWYQDNYYAATLKYRGYRHGLCVKAKAIHLHQQSHELLEKDELSRKTDGQRSAYLRLRQLMALASPADSITAIYAGLEDLTDKGTVHSYLEFYETTFCPYRRQATRLVEIGVRMGGVLMLWEKYFAHPEARVFGIGLNVDFSSGSRIEVIQEVPYDARVAQAIGSADIVIDDGSHELRSQMRTFENLWPIVRPQGIYIFENVQSDECVAALKMVEHFEEVDLRHIKGRYDDRILVLRKMG